MAFRGGIHALADRWAPLGSCAVQRETPAPLSRANFKVPAAYHQAISLSHAKTIIRKRFAPFAALAGTLLLAACGGPDAPAPAAEAAPAAAVQSPAGAQLGVPQGLHSCHTATVGGYAVEGHVPADVVRRLLTEKPPVKGIAVPGMPMGSPGMEGPYTEPYEVYTFDGSGRMAMYRRGSGAAERPAEEPLSAGGP